MTVDSIKEEINKLPEAEKFSLLTWLTEQSFDEWDQEMHRDFSPEGRGAHVVVQVEQQILAGKFEPMEERLRQKGSD